MLKIIWRPLSCTLDYLQGRNLLRNVANIRITEYIPVFYVYRVR